MAKYMFLSTDAFSKGPRQWQQEEQFKSDVVRGASGRGYIRRPYRGIQIKDDTYSSLSIRKPDGTYLDLVSSSSRLGGDYGITPVYADYILQRVDDQRSEKQQVIETFGDPFVYFYGERPRVVTFSGVLISSEDFNWRSQFWKNYDELFRGTKLVQLNARAYISYDTIIIEGYPLAASATDSADDPHVIPFSLQMFVTGYYDWSNIGSTRFPGKDALVNIDTLNKELSDQRAKHVSTSAMVRLKNLNAKGTGGLLSTIRKGMQAVNDVVSLVDGVVDQIHAGIGGRVIRVPIGVAGYFASIGEPTIASGSIDSRVLSSDALGKQFDAATGQYKGVSGSVKLRMPGYAKFATPWTSDIDKGNPVGFICENSDEYPQQESLAYKISVSGHDHTLGTNSLKAIEDRNARRIAAAKKADAELAKLNLQSTFGAIMGGIAEGVSFAKSAFGMVMTVSGYANMAIDAISSGNVEGALKSALGIQSMSLSPSGLFEAPLNTIGAVFGPSSFAKAAEGKTTPDIDRAIRQSKYTALSTAPVSAPTQPTLESASTDLAQRLLASPETFTEGPTSKYLASARKDKVNALGITTEAINLDAMWLGSSSGLSYQQALESGEEMEAGDVYKKSSYQQSSIQEASGGEGDLRYEEAYQSNDFTVQSTDPVVKESLKEAYGDLDLTYNTGDESSYVSTEQGTTIEKATAAAYATTGVYRTEGSKVEERLVASGSSLKAAVENTYVVGKKSLYRTTPEERLAIYLALKGTPAPNPEDTNSIRGSEDDDTEILPVL